MVGWVHEVIVENFKSYAGRVRVGPFRKFTCIVGPNGAGKSNLMEAIGFVLGVRTRHLRNDRLQECIHRKEGESPEQTTRTASVELVYAHRPDGSAETTHTVFRRAIPPGNEARFHVNGEGVSQVEYLQQLEAINILSKARNFLVFQGDVEAAVHRQGKDLTAFFEQVSGSIAFREEYEQLAAEKAQKEEQARYLYTKKRNAINERKRMEQQKEEAEAYQNFESKRRQLQVEFYLFRLHCLEHQAEQAAQASAQAEDERREAEMRIAARQRALDAAEAELADLQRASGQAEQNLATGNERAENINPERFQAESRLGVLQQRLKDAQARSEKESRKRAQLESQELQLRDECGKLEAELRELEEQIKQELPFTPEQREEFDRATRLAQQMTASSGAQARDLEAQISATNSERVRLEHSLQQASLRQSRLRQKVEDLVEAEGQARAAWEHDAGLAQRRGDELRQLSGAREKGDNERRQLQSERQQILRQVQDITATERQIQCERNLAQVSADLAQLAPGVHGRVLELCQPSQRRLKVAVNVALGGFLDAVVTDTAEGARQCVRHLKERRLDPMTFLPLDDIRAVPFDLRLQAAVRERQSLRLAINCVDFDQQRFRHLFSFMLGDVVIADTMDEGRDFMFGHLRPQGINCRLVTLAGEVISRDGNMAVSADAARDGSTRFDFNALETSKSRLEAIDRRLYEIRSSGSAGDSDRAALQEEVHRLEARARASEQRLQQCQGDLHIRQEELQENEATVKRLQPEVERLAQDESQFRNEQRELEESISQLVSRHFEQLSAAMGVDNIERSEREWRRARGAAQQRQHLASDRLSSASTELSMVTQILQEQAAHSPREAVAACQADIVALEGELAQIARDVEASGLEVGSLKAAWDEALRQEREKEGSVAKLRQDVREEQQQLAGADRQLASRGAEAREICDARAEVLRQSVLDDVELPLTRGSLDKLGALLASARRRSQAAADPAADIVVDLSGLPASKRSVAAGPATSLVEEEYRQELQELAKELEERRPNLKAIEQLVSVSEQARGASDEAVVARRDIEDAEQRFHVVREKRRERFLECFRRVQDDISLVYKKLTSYSGGPGLEGGSAYLDLEDEEDPFNGGIKFTAMPPMKRFSDIGLLSGGEKTLAAMALLFSIQAYQQPPFLLLDEIDAFLDGNNVQALARFVQQHECQTIVISLRDMFYTRSDGLVGVSRDKGADSSTVFTVDLAQFRRPAGTAAPLPPPAPRHDEEDVIMAT